MRLSPAVFGRRWITGKCFQVARNPIIELRRSNDRLHLTFIVMSALVQNLCKISNALFNNLRLAPQTEYSEDVFARLVTHLSQVKLEDLHLTPKELDLRNAPKIGIAAPVSFVSLFENDAFSLTVFGLRFNSSRIPLHDHPGMHGFVRCVYGSISVKSYSILHNANCDIPQIVRDKVRGHFGNIVPAVYLGEEIVLSESNQVCSLTPLNRNLHEIRPASSQLAVIADIISPPYTEQTNSFFYEIIDTIFDPKLNQSITWLRRTTDSAEFYCDTVPYCGPKINV